MFEGKLPPIGEGSNAGDDAEPLRELSWGDLVARLAAVRDLRRELRPAESSDAEEAPAASFDMDSARRISAQEIGQDLVNHNASAYRKNNLAQRRQRQLKTRENK